MPIILTLPDSVGQAPVFSKANWRLEMAIALFAQEQVTLGMASQIAAIPLMEFQKTLGKRGICMHYDAAEFDDDMQHLRDRGWL
ncbi:UPF0175 family protein [Nodosilinea sp. E11]|uniref:UPF0175 family protein n=1 Tax=Nodosilinea sp. E11 TaxID=3037479 RepID=UPI002934C4AE|nr:UPF0175 family protein [Nodosilinea sp. E11]WOD38496.1 UPF0175 family protein [Nodosilinea sp. E11]